MQKSRNVADVHHLRLMSLLSELVRKKGNKGAARVLGLDRRTVAASLRGGVLSRRVRGALERALVEGDEQPDGGRDALEQRVEALEREMREAVEGIRGEVEALRKEHSRTARLVERLFGQAEAPRDGRTDAVSSGPARRHVARAENRREYPELVTREPADDDEEVYGEAWPWVDEWRMRELRREVGTKLDRARTRERIMELEIAMIAECVLTLPPATSPMHPSERETHLGWRRRALDDLRRERTRLEMLGRVRRVLTVGLWRE